MTEMLLALLLTLTGGNLSLTASQDRQEIATLAASEGLRLEITGQKFDRRAKDYRIAGQPATDADLDKYLPLFLAEWKKYPPKLFTHAHIETLVLCAGLAVDGQERGAVPAFDLHAMYYDPALGSGFPHYQRTVIHHELFHFLDREMGRMKRDPTWAELNPPRFRYGSGGKNMRTHGVGELIDTIPGFLTPYGTAAIEEDKAELFAHLVVDRDFVEKQMAVDEFLRQKVAMLRQRLRSYFPGLEKLID